MNSDNLRPYDHVQARFSPRRTDDLKPGMRSIIGREGLFRAMWRIGEEDHAEYAGELAMMIPDELLMSMRNAGFGGDDYGVWVPSCDIEVLKQGVSE